MGVKSNKSITAYKLVFSPKIDSLVNMIYVRMDRMKNYLSIHSIVLNQCGVLFKCKEQNFGRCSRLKISLKMCELDSFLEPSRQMETRFQTFTWFITTLTSFSAPLVMWLLRHACVIYNPECFPAVTLSSVRVCYWSLSLCVVYLAVLISPIKTCCVYGCTTYQPVMNPQIMWCWVWYQPCTSAGACKLVWACVI